MEEWSGFGFLNGILITTAVSLFVLYRLRRRRLLELAEKIPGPPGLPVIGNALDFIGSSHNVFTNIYSKGDTFGDLAKFWIGSRLLVFLCHPADVELILSSHEHIDKSPEYKFFEPWLGSGLLISSGEMWKAHRKVIAPTFHLNILKSFFPQFNKNSRQTVEKLKEKVGKAEFDCHDVMSEATVEILLETVMGVNKSTQDSGFDYAMAVMKMCDILHLRHTKFYLRSEILFYLSKYRRAQDKFLNTIHSLTRKVFKIRKEEYIKNGRTLPGNAMHEPASAPIPAPSKNIEKSSSDKSQSEFSFGMTKGMKDDLDEDIGEKKRLAFLDYLIDSSENGVMLNDLEIQNQIDTIMFEGHDTTAAASSFFLCMMATRQDIQEKVYEELHKIFGDSDRDVTFQDTLEMKYLERCLMETMRMYPPVPIIARELQKEVKLASRPDLTIPANVTVIIATVRLHRRADVFPNPDHFDPDNFLPERSASRHYYSFIPFSAGPRSCVGRKYAMLKLKVLLANVLRKFKVVGGKPEKEWKLQADIILKRSDGFGVRLEPRKK